MAQPFDPQTLGLDVGLITIKDTNGADFDISYLSAGDSDAPLALCLHGYPDSAWTWRHLMPELAANGFHAVAPFNRGYSPSSIPSDGLFQAGVLGVDANLMHAALDGSGDAVIIGHDWGAMGAYAAATLAPEKWRRVVTAAVMPGPVAAQAFFSYDQLKLSWYMFFQMTSMAEAFIPLGEYDFISRLWNDWSPGYDATDDVAAFVESMPSDRNLVAALSYYRHTLNPDLQDDRLAAAQGGVFTVPSQPLLYLHGTDDGCMSPAIASTVGDHLVTGGSRAVMVPGTGHFLHLEKPTEVNAEVIEFVTSG